MRKTTTGIALSREALKKINDFSKRTGFSRSEIIDFLILKFLPSTEDEKSIEELAMQLTKFKLEISRNVNKKKLKIIIPKDIDNG